MEINSTIPDGFTLALKTTEWTKYERKNIALYYVHERQLLRAEHGSPEPIDPH